MTPYPHANVTPQLPPRASASSLFCIGALGLSVVASAKMGEKPDFIIPAFTPPTIYRRRLL
ncbi:hypothetical protein N9Z12_00525 [Opitutaceae bacterium]|nr:hypothetical protein [Opitutaceae bacterium]